MKNFTTKDIVAVQKRLAAMKRDALHEIDIANADIESGQKAPHKDVGSFSDDVETTRQGEVRFAEINIDRNSLYMIEEAERRIADGLYGLCVDCAEPIARERLLALPAAIRCAVCQQKLEQKPSR